MNYFNCRQPLETKNEKGMITVKNEEIELLKELKKVGINLDTDKDIYNYQKESRK